MPLTSKEKERLDKLDFDKGGGFSDFFTDRRKLESADSKFLFIGLGGKGSQTVASIKTKAYKKIRCEEEKRRPSNFEYLVIDTDSDNLEFLARGGFGEIGLSDSPKDSEICNLYDQSAAEKLKPENRRLIPNNIKEWMNGTMNAELQGRGAKGIRQAGRYLLFGEEAFESVRRMLELKLASLNKQIVSPMKEKLIVYIFAGVSGGTGSGIVIDIPYIIRKICQENNWEVKIYGYIFLPDTYSVEAKGAHLKYNGYAALKEIDTLMNIGQMDGAASFKATYRPGFSVDMKHRIFDTCVLVSGKKNTGLVDKPEKFSNQVVVDNIINLVTKNETQEGFLANSFLDNSPSEIQNKVDMLDDNVVPKNAYYQYTVIGTGVLMLPLEQIMAYIAHGTMGLLRRGWDNHANQQEVERTLVEVHMLPEEQAGAIIERSTVPLLQYTSEIGGTATKESVINGVLYNTLKAYWLKQNVALYNAWDVAKNHCLERIVALLNEKYYTIFRSPKGGIYFLKELFASKVESGKKSTFNGIYQRIVNEYMQSINGLIGGQEEVEEQIDQRMREIRGELSGFHIGGNNRRIEEYRELCVRRLVCENTIYLYDSLVRDCMQQIKEHLEKKIHELQRYIDVFTYLQDIVDRNYRCVMEDKLPQAMYAGKLLDFSDQTSDTTARVIRYMDALLKEKTPGGVAGALADRIIQQEDKWIYSEEVFNPMSVFVHFLEEEYGQLPNLSIEKFIELKYGADGFNNGMAEICQRLKNAAEVIFPFSTTISPAVLASHNYVVIPSGASNIEENMEAFARANGTMVSKSVDMGNLYWYNLVIGVPLFALKDIMNYEDIYEHNSISGMHIWESETESWKDFPALSNQKLWSNVDFNHREKDYMRKVKENTKHYLESGLLRKHDVSNLYYAFCLPERSQDVTQDIQKWCVECYMEEPVYGEEGEIDLKEGFVDRMAMEMGLEKYTVNSPVIYMRDLNDSTVYKLLRMNIFLYKKLGKMYQVYQSCVETISSDRDKKKNLKRFYDYARTGIIQITEDAVLLEDKVGEQEELMYFDEHTEFENEHFLYLAFEQFCLKEGEDLQILDDYKTELLEDHSSKARERYKGLSEQFMKECEAARDSLKQLTTKRKMAKEGKAEMLGKYKEFYNELLSLKVGKRGK